MKKKVFANLMGSILVGSLALGGGVYAKNIEVSPVATIEVESISEDNMMSFEDLLVKENIVKKEQANNMKSFTDNYYSNLNKKYQDKDLKNLKIKGLYESMVSKNIITKEELTKIKEFESDYFQKIEEKYINERVENYIKENIINKEEGKKLKEYFLEKNKENSLEIDGVITMSYESGDSELFESNQSTINLDIEVSDKELGLEEVGHLAEEEKALDLIFINEFDELVEKNIITKDQAKKMYELDCNLFKIISLNGTEIKDF